jgi:death on curing protein
VTKYLTADQVIAFHDVLLENFGGLAGIRDKNLLLSALDAPKAAFGGEEMYPSNFEKAAAYLFHLARNHPFNDGNKRTAYVATLAFLKANHTPIRFQIKNLEQIVIDVANGKLEKNQLAHFLKNGNLPKKKSISKRTQRAKNKT